MEKLNYFGIGPKIALSAFPLLVAGIIISLYYPGVFAFPGIIYRSLALWGILLLAAGIIFYLLTVRVLIKGLRSTRLVTGGTFYLCKNPLYASFILLLLPGLALVLDSWLILAISLVAYLVFKLSIRSEYREMEKFFGKEWTAYSRETPELLPFPFKKWFKRLNRVK